MEIRRLKTAAQVIDFCGGNQATLSLVARHLPHMKKKKQYVSNWRHDDRLPAKTFLIFQVKLKGRATAPSRLWGIVDPAARASA